MSNFKIKFILLLVVVLLSVPKLSLAFDVLDQKAVWLNHNTFLYTITYEFGFVNRDFRMPTVAFRDLTSDASSPFISYSFKKNAERMSDNFLSHAAVLSKAEIRNGKYYVAEGKKEKFTLVVIGMVPSKMISDKVFDGVSVQVDSLPFNLIGEGTETINLLHAEKIKDYTTPELKLK